MMGTVRSTQIGMGYTTRPDPGKTCGRCRRLTVVADLKSHRVPYCQTGGFNTWRDHGCARFEPANHGQERP